MKNTLTGSVFIFFHLFFGTRKLPYLDGRLTKPTSGASSKKVYIPHRRRGRPCQFVATITAAVMTAVYCCTVPLTYFSITRHTMLARHAAGAITHNYSLLYLPSEARCQLRRIRTSFGLNRTVLGERSPCIRSVTFWAPLTRG